MSYSIDLLKEFLTKPELTTVQLSDVTALGGVVTLTVDNLLHARVNLKLWAENTLGDVQDFEITAINTDTKQITLSDQDSMFDDTVRSGYISPLNFFHGTPRAISSQLDRIKEDSLIFPLAYVYERRREVLNPSTDGIYMAADFRLFILDVAKSEQWVTAEHYDNVIDGIERLVFRIKKRLDNGNNRFYQQNESYELIHHADWGVFATDKGNLKRIFNSRTSGTEMNFTLNIKQC